jgi:hypothetical protein
VSKKRSVLLGMVVVVAVLATTVVTLARRRAQANACCSTMVALCYASKLYAQFNADCLPSDFRALKGYSAPSILICPGDKTRTPAKDWAGYTAENCSYEMVSPGIGVNETETVFFRCKFHGHLAYSNCTVFDGTRRRSKE